MVEPNGGKTKTLFERNPRKTLVFTVVLLFLIVDVLARAVFNPAGNSFRSSSPYYHHDFLPNQDARTACGQQKYSVLTNSLGFRDRIFLDVPLASER